jgi:trigger factor
MLVPTDSAIKSGDNANINFAGKKDGKEFDGGKGEKFDLVIGSGSFIPGFEEQLIGMKAGDEKTIDVTFPKSYPHDELAGKPVQFDVKVNSVSNVEEPEFNKEYFTKFKIAGVESKEQFVEYLKQQIVD